MLPRFKLFFVHNLPIFYILWKFTHNFLSYSVNKQKTTIILFLVFLISGSVTGAIQMCFFIYLLSEPRMNWNAKLWCTNCVIRTSSNCWPSCSSRATTASSWSLFGLAGSTNSSWNTVTRQAHCRSHSKQHHRPCIAETSGVKPE